MNSLRIGSRKSQLALKQTDIVIALIKAHTPTIDCTIDAIVTAGDIDMSLPKNDESLKDKFVKEIEIALLQNKIDLAIHSLKDLPVNPPEGLIIPFFPQREDVRDCLVSSYSFAELPHGATIGTSSLRRTNQLKKLRPDLNIVPIRGNINTRIQKMKSGAFDGIVIAYAGIIRLGLEQEVTTVFSTQEIVPAPGQGMLGIQMRENDQRIQDYIKPLHSHDDAVAIQIELTLNRLYGGGCHTPFGAYVKVINSKMIHLDFYCLQEQREIIIHKQYQKDMLFETLALDIQKQ